MHDQKKFNNQSKENNQPELLENRTAWKPNNQGVKEETLIQIGRKGGEGQPGQRGHPARWHWVDPTFRCR